MYGLFGGGQVQDLTPEDVASGMKAGKIFLIDVREPNETAIERIPGALLVPLSTFDPAELPDPAGRSVVFSCASGIRSLKAAEIAQAAGLPHRAHLAGGLRHGRRPGCLRSTEHRPARAWPRLDPGNPLRGNDDENHPVRPCGADRGTGRRPASERGTSLVPVVRPICRPQRRHELHVREFRSVPRHRAWDRRLLRPELVPGPR